MDNQSFDFKRIAQGYRERPFLHKQVIQKFQNDMQNRNFEYGLDIGCGAGLSTKALKMICKHVKGTDISEEMILVADEVYEKGEVSFFTCKAEEVPIPEQPYDIVTAAGMIQWVDRDLFLKNLKRIMLPKGILFIYDFSITDRMLNNSEYTDWWRNQYIKKFPKPFRDEHIWTQKDISAYGFTMKKQIEYVMKYDFNLSSFINFMMIQSNVNAKIERVECNEDKIREWFNQTLSPVFNNACQTVFFEGYGWYIEKE